jgi:hypothetical protein
VVAFALVFALVARKQGYMGGMDGEAGVGGGRRMAHTGVSMHVLSAVSSGAQPATL